MVRVSAGVEGSGENVCWGGWEWLEYLQEWVRVVRVPVGVDGSC